jgi:hypothetical protein
MIPTTHTGRAAFSATYGCRNSPSTRGIRSFYGPCYLFQRSADQYIVVDIIQGMSHGPLPWDEVLARHPGCGDVALPVTLTLTRC